MDISVKYYDERELITNRIEKIIREQLETRLSKVVVQLTLEDVTEVLVDMVRKGQLKLEDVDLPDLLTDIYEDVNEQLDWRSIVRSTVYKAIRQTQ